MLPYQAYKHIYVGSEEDVVDAQSLPETLFFLLDGWDMMTLSTMWDEIADKMRYPEWAGRGWDPLTDVMRHLEQFDETPGIRRIILAIRSEYLILKGAMKEDKITFFEVLEGVGDDWAEPIQLGEWWDRPAIEFKVILFE